jgi:thioredoxin reductase (NADPH)
VDIEEDKGGESFVIEANSGKRRIPTITLADGSVLSNPSNADLAKKLGLKTTAERHHYDLIVVGARPAGLTAALCTAREGIDTLVFERAAIGGQAAATMHLDNVPGFPEGVTGDDLSARLRAQVERFGVEILQASAGLANHQPRQLPQHRNAGREQVQCPCGAPGQRKQVHTTGSPW